MTNVKPVCENCGSDNVRADAYAAWDVRAQAWELAGDVFDKGNMCESCEGETGRFDWIRVPIDPAPPAPDSENSAATDKNNAATCSTPATCSAPDALLKFVGQMASMSTPEDEFDDPENCHSENFDDVEEYISELDDERLCGEYHTFMTMVREARVLVRTNAQGEPMRVRFVGPEWIVELQSGATGIWIVQGEHLTEEAARADMDSWK